MPIEIENRHWEIGNRTSSLGRFDALDSRQSVLTRVCEKGSASIFVLVLVLVLRPRFSVQLVAVVEQLLGARNPRTRTRTKDDDDSLGFHTAS